MKSKKLAVLVASAMVATLAGFVFTLGASAAPATVRLHLGTDGKYFQYGSTTQNLTTAAGTCKINSPSSVMALSSTPSSSAPGLGTDGIGVRSGSSNGSPCQQVDPSESLTLKPGTALAGRSFTGVRLDLEMTGNAVVKLTLASATKSKVFQLQTGTSIQAAQKAEADYDKTAPYTASSSPGDEVDACAAPNSSGPNSGPNDNCQWTVQAGFAFTSATLTVASCGTVSLEGSNDFGSNPDYDTLFYLSNNPPTAVNDSYTTPEDTPLSANVLSNDSDSDGNPLTAALVTGSGPSHGTLTFAATGAFTYTPTLNYNGPDSFKYTASDGTDSSNQATVSITVTPVNDPPVAQNSNVTTDEDTPVTVTVATDVDSTVIHTTCTGAPPGSTLVDNGDGTVTYTPPANFNGGPVALSCTATDDQGASATSSATVNVTVTPVNDPPVANPDSAQVAEGGSVAIPVLTNDTDPDNDPLTPVDFTNVSPLGSGVVANADGTVQFTPPDGYSGPASFDYRASDGSLTSNSAKVSIDVFPVICSNETVTDTDAATQGSFTRLSDSFECKRYTLQASNTDSTVLFQPNGSAMVDYRGFVSFGSTPAPSGPVSVGLEYDPTGGNTYRPVQWCVAPTYDGAGNVLSASIPAGETWCIAGADLRPNALGDIVTVWQVYGHDDPRFR